jgi:hypothetical protein
VPRLGHEHDSVASHESAVRVELSQQRPIERKHGENRSNNSPAGPDLHGLRCLERCLGSDHEPVWPEFSDATGERPEAPRAETALDVTATGHAPGEHHGLVGLSLVGRIHRPELGLEPGVHLPLFPALRDPAEAPERGRQWQDREQQEVERKSVFEAWEHVPARFACFALVVGAEGRSHEPGRGCRPPERHPRGVPVRGGFSSACCAEPWRAGSRSSSPPSRSGFARP